MLLLTSSRLRSLALGAAAWLAVAAPAQTPPAAPPVAPIRDVPETFFGTVVHDPYRHLEDLKSPDTQAWMRAQAAHTRAVLDRIPGRAALRARLSDDERAVPARTYAVVRETGDLWFYLQRAAGQDAYTLVRRRGLDGPARVLVDPADKSRATGTPHAITYYAPAPRGRWVAYGLARGGAEDAVLHVVGAASGRHYGEPITRADFGGLGWSADGKLLFFNRLRAQPAGADPAAKYLHSQAWMWRPGRPLASARRVFGHGVGGVRLEPIDVPTVSMTHDGRWAIGQVLRGTQPEVGLWVSDAASVLAGRPHWRPLVTMADGVVGWTYMHDTLWLLSQQGASRRKVLALPVTAPSMRAAREIVAAGDQVLTGLAAAADALYLEARDGNVKRLYRRDWSATGEASPREVDLPVQGSFELQDSEGGPGAAHPRLPGLVLDLQGWTRARQIWQIHADGSRRNTGLQPEGPRDAPQDVTATEVLVPSHDGAQVPMSIIHKQGIALDGSRPLLLIGYAAYGMTEEPYFSLGTQAWLDAGGVVAVANPRGSGVFGDDWYRGGWRETKPNSWKDFNACAQWLVDRGWTRPERLSALGGSAGGILVGRAITERPDLYRAAVIQVGALDMVRSELSANGAPNIPEFGSRATEAGFRALLAMSTYHQIRDGVRYPAVLLTHGVNDPRVDVWESSKAAARLQAVSAALPDGRPALLRLDFDAGHGIGSTARQATDERADLFAFLLWQLGQPDYQPK